MEEIQNQNSITAEPKPDLTIRTMQSDISSLMSSGGVAPISKKIDVSTYVSSEKSSGIKGYSGPEQAIFGVTQNTSENQELYSNFETTSQGKSSGGVKTILLILFIMAIVGGLGFLSYVIALRFFSK